MTRTRFSRSKSRCGRPMSPRARHSPRVNFVATNTAPPVKGRAASCCACAARASALGGAAAPPRKAEEGGGGVEGAAADGQSWLGPWEAVGLFPLDSPVRARMRDEPPWLPLCVTRGKKGCEEKPNSRE